jgi:three-Cys-motif partner protein
MEDARYDEIGYWSEVKLAIVREYAQAYSTILTGNKLHHLYVDAFAGPGVHVSKRTGGFVAGSPLNALEVSPPFKEYHLIDLDGDKAESLRRLALEYQAADVRVHEGDCNKVLLEQVFPRVKWGDFRRALCLLDPYGIDLDWKVVQSAGHMETIDLFLNFMVMDANMNVLWHDPERVSPEQLARMDRFWGDRSWRNEAYTKTEGLFGQMEDKAPNEAIAKAFQDRLKKVAGFAYVPDPMPMRNSKGAVIYYLFFASQEPVARKIVTDVFNKYRGKGTS